MTPCDFLAFHALMVHGSARNISMDRRRRGYGASYIGNDVFYCAERRSLLDRRNPELEDGDRLDSNIILLFGKIINDNYI